VRSSIDLGSLGKLLIPEYDTVGGAISMFVYPKACKVTVIEPDRSSKEVESDLVVSLTEKEVLISDALIAELGIVILNPRTGLWRFVNDDQNITRHSHKQQLWI
jgi:hypothetical protein